LFCPVKTWCHPCKHPLLSQMGKRPAYWVTQGFHIVASILPGHKHLSQGVAFINEISPGLRGPPNAYPTRRSHNTLIMVDQNCMHILSTVCTLQ
jgi:hypothetical protein